MSSSNLQYSSLNQELQKMPDGEIIQLMVFVKSQPKLLHPILDMNDKYDYAQSKVSGGEPRWFYKFDFKAMEKANYPKEAIEFYKSYDNLTATGSTAWMGRKGTPKEGKFIGWSQQNMTDGYGYSHTISAITQFNDWVKNNTEKIKIGNKRMRYCKIKLIHIK